VLNHRALAALAHCAYAIEEMSTTVGLLAMSTCSIQTLIDTENNDDVRIYMY